MYSVGILLTIAIVAALAQFGVRSFGRRRTDLGFVSHQWINEHRQAQSTDHR